MVSAREAYEKWQVEWSDIHDHLPRLFEAAKGNCLEIGVRGGVSTSALLAGLEAHGGHLLSIDIDDCSHLFKGHPQWSFYRLNSVQEAAVVRSLLPETLDLLFIDGDHTFEAVFADLLNYAPQAERVLLHDTEAAEWPGVRQAVEAYVARGGCRVAWHSGSYGMAEITR